MYAVIVINLAVLIAALISMLIIGGLFGAIMTGILKNGKHIITGGKHEWMAQYIKKGSR